LPDVSSSLFFAPVALAVASVVFADDPVALSATSPPALSERVIVALTLSSTIASASARPITTVPSTASAFAVVVVFAVCVAESVTLPLAASVSEAAPPIEAVVVTCASVMAASAVSASVEPAAPAVPASA
jgi:hypothetical protein